MRTISRVKSIYKGGQLVDMLVCIAQCRKRRALKLPLLCIRAQRRIVIDGAFGLGLELLLPQDKEELLKCIGGKSGWVVGAFGANKWVVFEDLGDARKGWTVYPLRKERLKE